MQDSTVRGYEHSIWNSQSLNPAGLLLLGGVVPRLPTSVLVLIRVLLYCTEISKPVRVQYNEYRICRPVRVLVFGRTYAVICECTSRLSAFPAALC